MWDLRVPSGVFFLLLGAIVCGTGVVAPAWRAPLSAEVNVNLYGGVTMLIFGGVLLWIARRSS
jgi:hypothetical protein